MQIEIKPKTIIIAILIFLGIEFIVNIYPVILILLIAYILACTLEPIVDYLAFLKLNRTFAIFTIYVVLIGLFVGLITLGATPIIEQFDTLQQQLPQLVTSAFKSFKELAPELFSQINEQELQKQIPSSLNVSQILGGVGQALISIFQFSLNTVMVLILSGFILVEKGKKQDRQVTIFETIVRQTNPKLMKVIGKIEPQLGAWFTGQIFICLITGIFTYIVFTILGFEFALPIAIIAALLEAIPNIGPFVAALLGATISLGTGGSPIGVLIYLIAITLFEQFQALYIVPKLMEKAVGVNAIIILASLIVVANIPNSNFGIIFLTIPLIVIIQIFLEEYFLSKE